MTAAETIIDLARRGEPRLGSMSAADVAELAVALEEGVLALAALEDTRDKMFELNTELQVAKANPPEASPFEAAEPGATICYLCGGWHDPSDCKEYIPPLRPDGAFDEWERQSPRCPGCKSLAIRKKGNFHCPKCLSAIPGIPQVAEPRTPQAEWLAEIKRGNTGSPARDGGPTDSDGRLTVPLPEAAGLLRTLTEPES